MKRFAQIFYPTVKSDTFFESCGVADLITSCYGGRNRKVAEAFVRTKKVSFFFFFFFFFFLIFFFFFFSFFFFLNYFS